MYINKQNRIMWIDACRGIGILLVVLGHCDFFFNKYIYGFHMPLFFMLTGYLWKKESSFVCAIKKYFLRYIIPYFILCTINGVINCFIFAINGNDLSRILYFFVGIIYSRGSSQWMPNCSPLWFLTALFVALVVFYAINLVKSVVLKGCLLILCPIISASLSTLKVVKLAWNIDTALMAVLFILLGVILSKKQKQEVNIKNSIIVVLALLVIGVTAVYFNPIIMVNFDNNRYGNPVLMITGASCLSMVVIKISQIVTSQFKCNFLTFWGRHTIFVMGFDYLAGSIVNNIMYPFGFGNSFTLFIGKIIVLTIGIFIWTAIVEKIKNDNIRRVLQC